MNFKEIAKKCAPDEHCYHRDGVVLYSNPPQYRMLCCHCGNYRYEQMFGTDNREHGPFYHE